jgi:hypothetical protein
VHWRIQSAKQGDATASQAEPKTPNPHTGPRVGLNHLSRGRRKTANRGPARGSCRDVRARPTQARVDPAKGKAELPEHPRDVGGLREARPVSLNRLASQVPENRQGEGPKTPEGADRHGHKGQGGGHLPIRAPLGGVNQSRAAAANPGVRAVPPAKDAAT